MRLDRVLPALLLLGGLACASPVGVREVDAGEVHRTLTANVLTTGEPSVPTRQLVQRMGFGGRWPQEAEAVVGEIHAAPPTPSRRFALAELSFWLGTRNGERARYLAAAVYAWAYLFPLEPEMRPEPTDPRYRLACDLYNRGLTEGIDPQRLTGDDFAGEQVPLPFGSVEIRFDRSELEWSGWRLGDFTPAAYIAVRGLRNRYRFPGLGAPLVASLVEPLETSGAEQRRAHIPRRLKVPATALLRIEDASEAQGSGTVRARLELITQDESRTVEIQGHEFPLEFETSSALAATLDGPPIWLSEFREFLYGGVVPRLTADPEEQVLFLQPYRPGRIPVVLVHGTASSPMRWAELENELQSDPFVWDRYQIWLYRYDSGNPLGFSAGLFREALRATVAQLDPEGRDAALHQMVVVGHSQGGLLTKLTVVDSGDRFWRNISDKTFGEMKLEPDEREVLERSIFFTPLPFVRRVVFIATPHRGSYLTLASAARWLTDLVQVPNELTQLTYDFVARNRDDLYIRRLERPANAIDSMTPGNPFLRTLASLPVADGVAAHSIIAVEGDGPAQEGADGVVRYQSAHLEGVPERVVRSGHSCQDHPATIEEVRRILHLHAGGPGAEAPASPGTP